VDVIGDMGLKLSAKYDALETINYYGFGNDSPRDAGLESDDFYRVFHQRALFRSALFKQLSPASELSAAAAVKRFKTDLDQKEESLVRTVMPYGIGIEDMVELAFEFNLDNRDERKYPTRGIYFDLSCFHFPAVADNENAFTRGGGVFRFYLTPVRNVTFAFRLGGEKIWGTFPFYEAVFLGGLSSVRSFRDERFAGDASFSGSAELRCKILRPKIVVPMDTGFFVFADAGRVWLEKKSPGDWQRGSGGGIWIAPLYRSFTFSMGLAIAGEGNRFYFNGGFAF
jgi:outer membrane protein assembly factor BamA